MMKLLTPTNISEKLREVNALPSDIDAQLSNLIHESTSTNDFDFDELEMENIFHIETIKNICIDYRLRFLDVKYFKGDIPPEGFDKISELEKKHQTILDGFKIMAPSKLFRLKNTDDPLLFVPLGNNYYYLVHQWGNDLHPLRKLFMWPFKSIWNLLSTLLVISYFVTLVTPMAIFTKKVSTSTFWMVYFFNFKALTSVVLFYGFALGKNFNPSIWNNKYNKS